MPQRLRPLFLLFLMLAGVRAAAQPTANFTANVTQGCAPLLVQFTNTSTGTNSTTTYSWNFNNGGNSTLQNPSTTFVNPGTYTITLTATGPGGSNTKTQTAYITVHPSPVVSYVANDTDGCPPHPVGFTSTTALNAPGAATYLWGFGDGFSSTATSPTHSYATPGTYNTTLQVTNSYGCSQTITKVGHITVYTAPVAAFTYTGSTCNPPSTVTFNPTVTGVAPFTYVWDFGDGSPTSTASNPVKTYTASGSYTVTLIVTDSRGCKDTLIKPNYISVGTLNAVINAPSSVCEDAPITFINASTPTPTTAFWNFGNSTTGTGTAPTIVYPTPGTYTVRLVAVQGVCTDTAYHTVTVNPKPSLAFTASTQDPCPVPVSVQFNNTSSGAAQYFWAFGDGGTSTATSPTHTFTVYPDNFGNPPGNPVIWDTVTLVGITSAGCADTIRKPQYIRLRSLRSAVAATPPAGCAPVTTNFSAPYAVWDEPLPGGNYPFAITSRTWDFGDGSPTSTATSPTHTYTNPGTYWATLTYTTANGCTDVDSIEIRVGTPPTPDFTVAPNTACVNGQITFTNTSTNVTPGVTSYFWQFGNGAAATSTGGTQYNYPGPGTFTVILTANNNGCERSDTLVNAVTINPPVSDFTVQRDCDTPLLVRLTNNSIGATSYTWYFGDGNTSTALNPTHTYAATGNYSIKLVTYNSTFGCVDTGAFPVAVINPAPDWTTDDTAVCKGDSVTFTGIYPTGLAATWAWSTLPGLWVTDTAPPVWGQRYLNTGLYTVSLAVEDINGCWDTTTKVNHILVARPVVGFSATPRLGCTPLPVTFVDTSSNTPGAYSVVRDWVWSGPVVNTGTSTTPTISHTFGVAGLYAVKLRVTDNVGCMDSLTKPTYIDARHPEAVIYIPDTSVCVGQTIPFGNSSYGVGPLSYQWNFGNGGTSTAASPTQAYNAVGSYTVRLIVTDTVGCQDTAYRTITLTKPDAAFTVSDTQAICPPLLVQATNASTNAVSYAWNFGNGTSIIPNPSNLYTTPGQYNIRLIAADAEGCTDTAFRAVRVLGYAGALSYSPLAGCEPLAVQFVANLQNVPSIVWDFADGVTAPVVGNGTTTHVYTSPGKYLPKLLLSDGIGCLTSSVGLDTITVDGVIAGFETGPLCEKGFVTFTDTSRGVFSPLNNVQWTFHGGQTGSGPIAQAYYAASGAYTVTLIAINAAGCRDTVVRTININTLPVVTASPDTIVCLGDGVVISATGATSYAWTPASTLDNAAIRTPRASPTVPTVYTVAGTDANGCVGKDSVRVNLQLKTTFNLGRDTAACFGTPVRLRAWGADRYEWKPALGLDNPTSSTPVASPPQTTTYTVVAKEGNCYPDSARIKLTVHPKPVVSAGADAQIVLGGAVQLVATGSDVDDYLWASDPTLSCAGCSDPTARPVRTTAYTVYASNRWDCHDTDDVTVVVLCDASQLFVPNSFSPNNDGENDRFFPHGTGLSRVKTFRVFNRWGQIVFERADFQPNESNAGWDGTFGGAQLPPDAFAWVLEAECENGETLRAQGDVTLVR